MDRDTYPGYVLLCPVPGQFAEDGLTGGIAKRESPGQHVVNFVLVESIDDYTAKAETLGAIVLESKAAIPTVGWRSVILDTEGNTIGMFQPDENAG
ncbi:MAG: hypothetical protein O3C10_13010 [Chloroflexi bacterium]|nr:hypothetical protein [Chloroflexota bacterium]